MRLLDALSNQCPRHAIAHRPSRKVVESFSHPKPSDRWLKLPTVVRTMLLTVILSAVLMGFEFLVVPFSLTALWVGVLVILLVNAARFLATGTVLGSLSSPSLDMPHPSWWSRGVAFPLRWRSAFQGT